LEEEELLEGDEAKIERLTEELLLLELGETDDTADNLTAGNQIVTANLVPNLKNKCSGGTFDINFVLSNSSISSDAEVDDGTIAINIPPGFIVNTTTDQDSDFTFAVSAAPHALKYSDGSQQIAGTFTDLGGTVEEAMIVTLNLTAPIVTANVVYIFTVVADGFIQDGVAGPDPPIGPLLQFPVQIIDVSNPGSCTDPP